MKFFYTLILMALCAGAAAQTTAEIAVELGISSTSGCDDFTIVECVVIANYDTTDTLFPLDSLSISFAINGGAYTLTSYYSDTLLPGQADTVCFTLPMDASDTLFAAISANDSTLNDTDNAVITISNASIVGPFAGNDAAFCFGDSVQLGAPDTIGYVFAWSPATSVSDSTVPMPYAGPFSATDTLLLVVTASDSAGICSATDTVQIIVLAPPSANAGPDTTVCNGVVVSIGGSPTGPAGATYQWTPAFGLNFDTVANPLVNTGSGDSTFYSVTVTDSNGCVASDTALIESTLDLDVNAGNDTTMCAGGTFTLGGSPTYFGSAASLVWMPAFGLNFDTIANPIFTTDSADTYGLIVTVMDTVSGLVCSDTDSAQVVVMPLPSANAGADTIVCQFESITLGGSPTADSTSAVDWNLGQFLDDSTDFNPIATLSQAGTFSFVVTATDTNGCSFSDTVIVVVNPSPLADAGPDTNLCGLAPYVVGASPSADTAFTILWQASAILNDSSLANPTASFPTVGNYSFILLVTDTNGCTNSDSLELNLFNLPTVDAGSDTNICPGDTIEIGGSPTTDSANTVTWSVTGFINNTTAFNPLVMFASGGSFNVIVTASDSQCSASDTAVISVITAPTVDAGPDTTICTGDTIQIGGSPTTDPGYAIQWSSGFFLNFDTAANPLAFNSISNTFILQITDSFGCQYFDTTDVFVYLIPALEPGGDTAICLKDSAELGGSPTALNYASVLWSPAAGLSATNVPNPMASPAATTSYIVDLVDTFGCAFTDTMTVTVLSLPTVDAGSDTSVCPFTEFIVGGAPTIQPTSTVLWAPSASFDFDTIANPLLSTGNTTASYTATATDTATGCLQTDTLTVSIYTEPFADMGADTFTLCEADSLVLGGSPTALAGNSINWSPGIYLSDSTAANPTLYGTFSYFLYLTVVDAVTNCPNVDTALVIGNPLPDVDAGDVEPLCIGQSIMLGGSPTSVTAPTFQWSLPALLDDETIANPTATPTQDTLFFVTVTSNEGCQSVDSIFVEVNDLPIITLAAYNQVCALDSTQLSAAGGIQYAWSNGAFLSNNSIANPLASAPASLLYIVTVTDTNGCQDTAHQYVQFYPLPPVDAGPDDTLCTGGVSNLNASGALNYLWSPSTFLSATNISNPVSSATSTITYYLTGSDANNCTVVDSLTVFVNLLPAINAGGTFNVCMEDSVQLGGNPTGQAGSNFDWTSPYVDDDVANPYFDATGLNPGNYIVTLVLTDFNDCVSTDQCVVSVLPLPTPTTTAIANPICVGETLVVSAFGGVAYNWSPAADLTSPTLASTGAHPDITTLYTVTVTGSNGCSATTQMTLPVHPLTQADAGPNQDICQQDTLILTASGGVAYNWSASASLSNLFSSSPQAFPAVSETFTVTVTDTNNCSQSDDVTLTVRPLPAVGVGLDQRICLNDDVVIGGNPTAAASASVAWSPAAALNDSSLFNPTAAPTTTTTFKVVVTSTFGCQDSGTIVVVVDTLPIIKLIDTGEVICLNDTTTLSVRDEFENYQWSPTNRISSSSSDSVSVWPAVPQTYFLTVTDANGCRQNTSFSVEVLPLPTAYAGIDIEMCSGDSVPIRAEGGVLYAWSDGHSVGDSTAQETWAKPLETTTYTLSATDTNGCVGTAQKTVIVFDLPFADAGEDIENCDIDVVTIGGSPTGEVGSTFVWSPTIGLSDPLAANPTVLSSERTVYYVEVQDENGCRNTDSVLVNADCYAVIYAPTAFTPGSNGINDEFKIVHYRITEPTLTIYNRWGEVVFTTNDLDVGWDGSNAGNEKAMAGTYFWELIYRSDARAKLTKQGAVTLIR